MRQVIRGVKSVKQIIRGSEAVRGKAPHWFGTYAGMMGTQFYFCVFFLFETCSLFLIHKHT